MAAAPDRQKALDAALAQIDKQFGKGSVMRLGDEVRAPIEVIPTGSIALDVALGIGGLPRGRVVEIYGPESSGKTTVALHAVANAQRDIQCDGTCRNDLDGCADFVAEAHDRAFAELLVNLGQRCVKRFLAIRGCGHGSHLYYFLAVEWPFRPCVVFVIGC